MIASLMSKEDQEKNANEIRRDKIRRLQQSLVYYRGYMADAEREIEKLTKELETKSEGK